MMHHAQIAQRAFNTPLMVDPAKALAFLSGLGPRITGQEITFQGLDVEADDQAAAAVPARASLFGNDLAQRHQRNGTQPYAVVDGIAVIEIAGTLVHRGAWIGQSSGLTFYEGIAAQLQAALADPGVRGIALDIDSFGGKVAGAFDLADRIRAARAQKPVHAFVAEHALSAGYVLASQADRIILPRTGAVGSTGVVALHTDMSGALDQKGIAVTLIHAGAHKVDANPYGSIAALATTLTIAAVINAVGIGFQRGTHANWQLVTNDGTGAPTLTDMGAPFAIALGGVLTLFIAAPPNGSSVWVRAVNEVSGAVFEQEITADLPANTQFLSPRLYLNTGATAAAVAYDCAGLYLETDY